MNSSIFTLAVSILAAIPLAVGIIADACSGK